LGTLLTCAACVAVGLLGWFLWPTPDAREDADVAALISDETSGTEDAAPESRSTTDASPSRVDAAARLAAALDPAAAIPASVPPAVLVARIVGPHETPLAGARLRVRDEDLVRAGQPVGTSDADGRVRLSIDLAGLLGSGELSIPLTRDIELEADAPAHTLRELSATIAPGRTVELGEIALEPAGTLTGRMVDEDGRPLRGLAYATLADLPAELRASSAHRGPPQGTRLSSAPCATTAVSASRACAPAPVAPGAARRAGCGRTARRSSSPRGATVDCGDVVVAVNPFAIRGRVEDPAGKPLGGFQVLFGNVALASWMSTSSDEQGAFVIDVESESVWDLMADDEASAYTPALARGRAQRQPRRRAARRAGGLRRGRGARRGRRTHRGLPSRHRPGGRPILDHYEQRAPRRSRAGARAPRPVLDLGRGERLRARGARGPSTSPRAGASSCSSCAASRA
jgi:hypothetical protein